MEDDLRLATPEEIEELEERLNRLLKQVEEDRLVAKKIVRKLEKAEAYLRGHL